MPIALQPQFSLRGFGIKPDHNQALVHLNSPAPVRLQKQGLGPELGPEQARGKLATVTASTATPKHKKDHKPLHVHAEPNIQPPKSKTPNPEPKSQNPKLKTLNSEP